MADRQMSVQVSNIGGIDEAELTFEPGVTVLTGRNATNRTSFLQAIMAAFGSDQASLKADTDEGSVELTLGDEQVTRTLTRTDSGVSYGGNPYLDDPEVADLFAFLMETNEARISVPRGDDLRDIIMRPVDTAAIQQEIEELVVEKREIEAEIEERESLAEKEHELERRLTQRRRDIEQKEVELEEKQENIEALEADLEETRQKKNELEETFSDLRNARQEHENLQARLETEQESLESLETEKRELAEEREELDTFSEQRLDTLNDELRQLRNEKQEIEAEVSKLQRVIQFNEELIEDSSPEITNAVRPDGGSTSDSLTDELVEETEVVCWTCGSRVDEPKIEDTIDCLRTLLNEYHGDIQEIDTEIDDVLSQKQSIESKLDRAEEVSRRQRQVEEEIERRRETIAELCDRIDQQSERIENLEEAVDSLEDDSYDEIIETHKEANQVEFELDRLRTEVSDIEAELESVRDRTDDLDALRREREAVNDTLHDLRTKIDRLEADTVEAFNEHMDEVLHVLEYENIDRIWLERTEQEVRDGRRKEQRSTFELHIVRSMNDGTTYEDTIEHLSESEREVTGLIFALAGYLVHDVQDVLPVMLVDSLEAIDSERIASLVEYFGGFTDYFICALLPEDAAALNDSYDLVQEF